MQFVELSVESFLAKSETLREYERWPVFHASTSSQGNNSLDVFIDQTILINSTQERLALV